ncbi:MAG TPA: helicase-related protein, partial [Thermoanaerobaculia bacterium]|nr:helicase-related protein [Thermoanaerobaculia bacterium]
ILDPQRFTRGVPVVPAQRDAVMVRRLKSDLRQLDIDDFPERRVIEVALRHDGAAWIARHTAGETWALGDAEPFELRLAQLLAEYTALVQPRKGRGRLVFVNLQKRLLSSVEAFFRTLQLHARAVREGRAGIDPQLPFPEEPAEAPRPDAAGDGPDAEYGPDEAGEEAETHAEIAAASRRLPTPQGRALALLDEMLELAERYRAVPDAKALALLDWIRRHQCPAVRAGGAAGSPEERRWDGRRLLVFTEYADTKLYLRRILAAAFAGTADGDRRLLEFHGGMSDDQREHVQRSFNRPPDEHPVRVLLATDAAREGVNLQGYCADLFHFDVPWNPARLEQRNGRLDRTLQPSREVRCHYFVYPQREEDRVLSLLVVKVDRIRRELGSLSAVLMDRLAELLENGGIGAGTAGEIEAAEQTGDAGGKTATVREELEAGRLDAAQGVDLAKLRKETDEAARILEDSRRVLDPDPALLREVVDVGLRWADAAGPLRPADPPVDPQDPTVQVFELPAMPESWQATLDTLRPARERGEPVWEHRRRPPLPVTFRPVPRLAGDRAHLHLQHPFIQRILARFLAQGYSAHDLARVTVLRTSYEARARVLAFGRLSLFGPGAVRLHDEILTVAALWLDGGGPGHLEPFADAAEREALAGFERLLRELPHQDGGDPFRGLTPHLRDRLTAAAPGDFAALWPALREEADGRVHDAELKLTARGQKEAADLRRILETQKLAIRKALGDQQQLAFQFTEAEKLQRDQFERDRQWMERRLVDIDREIAHEPEQLRGLYRVVLPRLEPVGMVYLWPETR